MIDINSIDFSKELSNDELNDVCYLLCATNLDRDLILNTFGKFSQNQKNYLKLNKRLGFYIASLAEQVNIPEPTQFTNNFVKWPKKQERKHEQVCIELHGELRNIDKNILPLIVWMNSLEGIATVGCCEGEDTSRPGYVMFISRNTLSFEKVIDLFSRKTSATEIDENRKFYTNENRLVTAFEKGIHYKMDVQYDIFDDLGLMYTIRWDSFKNIQHILEKLPKIES